MNLSTLITDLSADDFDELYTSYSDTHKDCYGVRLAIPAHYTTVESVYTAIQRMSDAIKAEEKYYQNRYLYTGTEASQESLIGIYLQLYKKTLGVLPSTLANRLREVSVLDLRQELIEEFNVYPEFTEYGWSI